jgi:hypothetical protein
LRAPRRAPRRRFLLFREVGPTAFSRAIPRRRKLEVQKPSTPFEPSRPGVRAC